MKNEIQFALRVAGTPYSHDAGKYARADEHAMDGSHGFNFTTSLEDAALFPTADAAAQRIANRRRNFAWGQYVIVPVQVTTAEKTTYVPKTETTTTRTLA